MNEQQERETEEFDGFVKDALRLRKRGSFEQLLCQHLVQSVFVGPLEKVRLICEAAFMVESEKVKLDTDLIERIYTVTLSFLNTTSQRDFISFAWPFNLVEENYQKYISPWHKIQTTFFLIRKDYENLKHKYAEFLRAKTTAEMFFIGTTKLNVAPATFQMLKSQFLLWSIPHTMRLFEKLSRLIDPDLYKEILQAFTKKEGKQ